MFNSRDFANALIGFAVVVFVVGAAIGALLVWIF